ncbi:EAL domain-containing protein [Vibrio panuliri]|uniref:EAL domain-containing protein n=1 Tax=Vibrio panuliri TaxID=1381081 RepID=UPI0012479490|nr:EAL domain-containing protein [Vibrio panuliri]KAB1457256.1 EAL domain-containing protein [Vibrio panuliri]
MSEIKVKQSLALNKGQKLDCYIIKGIEYKLELMVQPIISPIANTVIAYEILSSVLMGEDNINSEDFFSNLDDSIVKSIFLSQLKVVQEGSVEKVLFTINAKLVFFLDDDFVDQIILQYSRPFVIEITDIGTELTLESYNKIIFNIQRIKQFDILLWLDDYSHYSPDKAASLMLIEWDCIKIDKKHLKDEEYLKVLINLFLKRFRYIVVEGIENESQLKKFTQFHVLLQGYYISKPLPISQISTLKYHL